MATRYTGRGRTRARSFGLIGATIGCEETVLPRSPIRSNRCVQTHTHTPLAPLFGSCAQAAAPCHARAAIRPAYLGCTQAHSDRGERAAQLGAADAAVLVGVDQARAPSEAIEPNRRGATHAGRRAARVRHGLGGHRRHPPYDPSCARLAGMAEPIRGGRQGKAALCPACTRRSTGSSAARARSGQRLWKLPDLRAAPSLGASESEMGCRGV